MVTTGHASTRKLQMSIIANQYVAQLSETADIFCMISVVRIHMSVTSQFLSVPLLPIT